jgi:two-component system copper resistance phosphate regulon response regulator CusR
LNKLLLVEDEEKTGSYLTKGLTESGYNVDWAQTGREALALALSGLYDLIVLDVMLPDKSGWDILLELRKKDPSTPVIYLSALDDVHHRVKGLELGADDYLGKPFSFSELLARIRTLLRRNRNTKTETHYQVNDLKVDIDAHTAYRAGQKLDLTKKEFALLCLLLEHRGEVLSRTLIASQIWGINFDSQTNVVDVAIKRLREKVDTPFEQKLIKTVRGMGYIIEN